VEGILEYRFPQEKEDYTIDDPSSMDVDIDPELIERAHPEAQHSNQRSNLRLFPPPIFSRQGIPQNYKCARPCPISSSVAFVHLGVSGSFKANPMSVSTTVVDERTGEEKKRYINKSRWKGFGPTSVSFFEKGVSTWGLRILQI
jgi:general transcription factor 3C polypeptide 5 (transcription factor C subunit 1)